MTRIPPSRRQNRKIKLFGLIFLSLHWTNSMKHSEFNKKLLWIEMSASHQLEKREKEREFQLNPLLNWTNSWSLNIDEQPKVSNDKWRRAGDTVKNNWIKKKTVIFTHVHSNQIWNFRLVKKSKHPNYNQSLIGFEKQGAWKFERKHSCPKNGWRKTKVYSRLKKFKDNFNFVTVTALWTTKKW